MSAVEDDPCYWRDRAMAAEQDLVSLRARIRQLCAENMAEDRLGFMMDVEVILPSAVLALL